MRNRIRQAHGTFELQAASGPGTRVRRPGQPVRFFVRRPVRSFRGQRRRPYEGNSKRFR